MFTETGVMSSIVQPQIKMHIFTQDACTQATGRRSVIDLIEEFPRPQAPEGDLTKQYMEHRGKKQALS
jgi:hypothetical protein